MSNAHEAESWSPTTECHRGILRIRGEVPALSYRPTLAYEPLGERLWTVSDGTYRSVFVEGSKAITAFDTFYSPGAATSYRLTIDRLFPRRPIETIVYSHDHLDHTGFGADLAPEARVVAHADAAAVVAARESDGQLPVTDAWEGDRLELELDGLDVELVYPGPTHGNGNVAALFPSERVLFMVDTVAAGVGYTFYPDWHLASYVPSMRRLLDLPWDRFVPGHLWPLDRAGFAQALAWWEALEAAAAEADAAGVDPDDLADVSAFADEHLRPDVGLARPLRGVRRAQPHAVPPPPPHRRLGPRGRRRGMTRLEVEVVAAGVWSVFDGRVRALVAEGAESVVCVGTLSDADAARALASTVSDVAGGKPVGALVYPIDHLDQAGNGRELQPASVVAHVLCARVVRGRAAATQPAVTRTVAGGGETLDLDGIRVALVYPGPSQGTGNVAVHLPDHDLLYVTGPRADARYGLFADVHVEHVARSWRRLVALGPRVVVAGRGPALGPAGLERACRYVESLQLAMQKAFATGVPVWSLAAVREEAIDRLAGDFGDLDGFREHVGLTALRVIQHYLMGGWGLEDGARPELLEASP